MNIFSPVMLLYVNGEHVVENKSVLKYWLTRNSPV